MSGETIEGLLKIGPRFYEGKVTAQKTGEENHRPESWSDRVWSWDPDRIIWVETTGERGKYEKADFESNSISIDFKNMLKDLKDHNGRLTRNKIFYWIFDSGDIAGRKLLKTVFVA